MLENFRHFRAGPDPFGRTWQVDFLWLQTAIAIRHSDTVDVKFLLSDGDTRLEKVIALPHAELVALSQKAGRPLTDPWCARLAALHLVHMIETGEDFEKNLVTVSPHDLEKYHAILEQAAAARK
ncbi:MAG: hypothetical protein RMK57_05835 [Bryobacterales bacterium]|nr:hypothetical protein [Bryobacteraceae bacterium]MDW8354034.1 hypothetical protein [Bryobacterales bacterium]